MLKISVILILIIGMLPNFSQKEHILNKLQAKFSVEKKVVAQHNYKVPEKKIDFQEKTLGAKSAYFADYDTGYIFFEKDSQKKLPMASTTKLMTAIIALEKLNKEKIIEIKNINNHPLDAIMGLSVGDKIKMIELLHGLLIESGADSARALAIETAGSEENFVAIMNETAKNFGLENTQFTNVVGYDENGHYSTAEDLYKLAKIALTSPTIKGIISKKEYTAKSEQGKVYKLTNTNKLLSNPYVKGVKTGTTLLGGECLIALYDDGEKKIIGVILNSPDRFNEASSIFGWTQETFTW